MENSTKKTNFVTIHPNNDPSNFVKCTPFEDLDYSYTVSLVKETLTLKGIDLSKCDISLVNPGEATEIRSRNVNSTFISLHKNPDYLNIIINTLFVHPDDEETQRIFSELSHVLGHGFLVCYEDDINKIFIVKWDQKDYDHIIQHHNN